MQLDEESVFACWTTRLSGYLILFFLDCQVDGPSAELLTTSGDGVSAFAVGEKSKVANSHESGWQDMEGKTAEKLEGGDFSGLPFRL